MATPPPEAPSVIKEEKPQLPPSPNGVSDGGPTGVKSPAADAKPDASVNGKDERASPKPAEVNGHGADQKTPTNGADAASPPKSPARTPVDAPPQEPASSEAAKPSNMDSAATDDVTKETVEDKPSSSGPTVQEPANGASADKPTPGDTQPTQDVAKPSAEEPSSGTSGEGQSQQPQESPSVKTELPHHPSTSAKPDSASNDAPASSAPSVPPLETTDQEMKDAPAPDAPVSPTKVSREREPDPADEPAAKRTKIGGEESAPVEFKVPEPPTPTTEAPTEGKVNGDASMTKVQHKFLLKGIQNIKRMKDARFFKEPVDPIKLNIPHYPQFIKKPMDLGNIERKLKENEYKSAQEVVDDFALMVQNSLTFNGSDHIVSQEGLKLKAIFDKQMVNLPKPDEVEEQKPKKTSQKTSAARREPRTSIGHTATPTRPTGNSPQATTFALGPEGLPLIRRDSTTVDGRPKRSIHPPKRDLPYSTKPKKKKYQWELRFCQELLEELHKPKHYNYAMPFYSPVDPVALNIPTYHSIIKKPMDLSTVSSKLKTGQYENAKEFELDMRQIFKNCFKFNLVGDPTYLAGQKFQEVFNEKWAKKAQYLEHNEPHPEHHSAASSDESEEEAEESESDNEKLGLLQKQIAEMSRQVEAITQKKKKTPPGSKKIGGKAKSSSKKEGKKSAVANPAKKDKKSSSSKISKPEKPRWVTYHEKQLISNGISSLPDKKMQEALKIIQSNVPSLKGTQETEIELDIDELPNDVLLMLLKFVKKNVPHIMEEEEAPAPAATTTNNHAAPPKPKKNKPMSKYEQEAQINMLQSNLSRFEGGGGRSPDPMPSVEANESSDDSDDDSEESEEE